MAASSISGLYLGAVAVIATRGAISLARRVHRVAQVLPVLALCVTSAAVGQVLWSRL